MEENNFEFLFKKIINNSKLLIDRDIFISVFKILFYIFIRTNQNINEMNEFVRRINDKYNLRANDRLSIYYRNENLFNIIKFVKKQNSVFANDILENIFILIFSFAFKTSQDCSFGKYIYNNIDRLKNKQNYEFVKWFVREKLRLTEGIKDLLKQDVHENDNLTNPYQNEEPIYNFIRIIYDKNLASFPKKKKIINYINRRNINLIKISANNINSNQNDSTKSSITKTISQSSMISQLFYNQNIPFAHEKLVLLPFIRSFFISVYIYYQNKNSSLMRYRRNLNNQNNLEEIPFKYDISEAGIEDKFGRIVMSPLRIEPRLEEIIINKNRLKENAFIELAKILLFNKNINKIYFAHDSFKSYYLDFFNKVIGLFDNYSVKVLNLSYNYLREDSSEYLANILSHFKGVKAINLSKNDLKNGISSFLITLKKLYRERKINLEKLSLNQCLLDDIAFYELGELLKSKYCKLKYLYLNVNNIPSASNFLKKLKKNKSLVEIYFNENNIDNNDTDCILRIISYTNIECLYLYNNKIHDFSQCLRIIYRTKLIKDRNNKEVLEEKIREDANLFNLDVSHNLCYNKNKDKIELIYNLIDDTTLYCLDFTKIIYDEYPEKFTGNDNYTESVDKLKNKLEKEQNEYNNKIGELLRNEVDKERALRDIKENSFNYIDDKIQEIIENEKANNNIFLRLNAKNLVNNNDEIWNNNINENNGKTKKEIFNDLLNYLKLKRADKNIKEINNKINLKKMILI